MTPAHTTGFRLGYRPSLDGLRGISILAVMAFNAKILAAKGGFIGVDIFFVLSGFLITTLLVEEWDRTGSISLRRFYLRRALRLLPALAGLLAAICLYAALFQPSDQAGQTYLGAFATFFYVANWAMIFEFTSGLFGLSHAWSLSVEEQFYLLWPPLLATLFLLRLDYRKMLILVGTLIVASVLWRAALWHSGVPVYRVYCGSDSRADALLIGCAAGLLFCRTLLPDARYLSWLGAPMAGAACVVLLAVGIFASWRGGYLYYGLLTLVALAAAILILHAVAAPSTAARLVLEFPPLVWFGKISYSLYLWHVPAFAIHFERLVADSALILGLRFATAFALAIASFYVVEQPFLRLKGRLTAPPAALGAAN